MRKHFHLRAVATFTSNAGRAGYSLDICALGVKFWDARPFTRIVEWGREFRTVCRYVAQNTLEALGFIPYQPRKHKTNLVAATA